MDSTLIIVAVIALIAVVVFFKSSKRKSPRGQLNHHAQGSSYSGDGEQVEGFPYELQHNFLSPAELNFFRVLRDVVGSRAVVCPKVGLGDVFWVQVEDKNRVWAYRNKIDRKHVDFLLCNPTTMKPLIGIELDDSSHQRADRQVRDEFVDGVFEAANLPLLHIPVQRGYVVVELAAQLAPYLGSTLESAPTPVKPAKAAAPAIPEATKQVVSSMPAATANVPRCPKCGDEMVLRTAKNGPNAGSKFWGCPNYPNCRSMLPYRN